MFKSYSMELAGRNLTIETGKMAGLANGSVLVKYGETTVLVNATASKEPKEGIDFFPLSVEYNERLYSVGKIPGGFTKREGKPAEKAILTSRAIDRPLRPLFPKDFRNDVVIDCLVLSVEQDCSPEVCAMIGASCALSISDIPFGGPTAAVAVGFVDGQVVINPTEAQRAVSRLNLTVAGTIDKIAMIEAGAYELTNEEMLMLKHIYFLVMLNHLSLKFLIQLLLHKEILQHLVILVLMLFLLKLHAQFLFFLVLLMF